MAYTDLIIRLSKESPNHFVATAFNEGKSVASNSFELKLDELRVMERLRALEKVALSPKSEETFHVDFGQELYNLVLTGNIGTYYQAGLDEADDGLRIRLQFDDNAKDLMTLPWEFLHDGEDFLVARRNTLISRMPAKVRHVQSKPLESMLRMLVVVSAPNDPSCTPLNSEQERERILEAVDRLYVDRKIDVDFTEDATFETIQSYLNEKDYHIVHFTGHGRHTADQGYLVLETDDFRAREVDVQTISDLFVGRGIRMVVLSACQSSDLANRLVKSKVPAVVAMQYSVLDTSATIFASAFYKALSRGKAVDLSLAEARIAMRNVKEGNKVDFATPVLYLLDPHCLDIGQIKPSESELSQKPIMLGDVPAMKRGFVGRQREMRLIQKGFISDIKRAAIIYGFGGIGKTVLATRLAQRMDHHFDGVFGFMCQPQTKQEDILKGLNAFLNLAGISNLNQILTQPIPIRAKVAALVSILNQRRFLIIFDNFESCLDGTRTKIADEGLKDFVTHLLNATVTNTKYLITTRYDFDPLEGRLVEAVEHLSLGEMPSYQAIWLMNSHADLAKLDPKKKTQIFKAVGGHPWTIGMFARHASNKGADALIMELEPVKKELREFALFDKSYSLLDATSKELLLRASIFEEAVPVVALRWMMGTESLPSPSVDEPLEKLMQWGLMVRLDEREGTLYSVHTLIREFVSKEAEAQKADRKKLLMRAALYYENKTKVSNSLWDYLYIRDYYYRAEEWYDAGAIAVIAWDYLARWGYVELAMNILNQTIETTSGLEKAAAMGNLATLYQRLGDWETALELISDAKEIFEKEGDERNLAQSLHSLAIMHQQQGNYAEAIKLYQQSLKIRKELGNKSDIASSLFNMGNVYFLMGNYSKAVKLFQQSMIIFEELEDKVGIASALAQMGNIHLCHGNYSETLDLCQKSLYIFEELGDKRGMAQSQEILGKMHLGQGNSYEAAKLFLKSLDIFEDLGNRDGIAGSLHNLGRIHQLQGNYAEATKFYEQSLDIKKEIGDKKGIASTLHQLGMIDEKSGDFENAFSKYALTLSLLNELKDPDGEIAENSISRLKEKMGENAFKKALESLKGS